MEEKRKEQLESAYQANIVAGCSPYAAVLIGNTEELTWIYNQRNWSARFWCEENKSRANLSDADLSSANLSDADLSDADLRGASLSSANLRGANLSDADLSDASLSYADLSSADLSSADLRGASLRGADLSSANLSSANLRGADLSDIKADIITALDAAPLDTAYLLHALEKGQIEGSMYENPDSPCACLKGTQVIAASQRLQCSLSEAAIKIAITRDVSSPAERWFLAITRGMTPENSPIVAWTTQIVRERLAFYEFIARNWEVKH